MTKFRDVVVRVALALALFIPLYFAFAALGSKFHLIDWQFGLGTMMVGWGVFLLMGGAAIALIALVLALVIAPRRGRRIALVALLIPVLGLGYGLYVRANAQKLPPIHDVSTDLANPPAFSASVEAARAAVPGGNDLERVSVRMPTDARLGQWSGMSLDDMQRQGFPDIAPLETAAPPPAAFDAALAAARAQNWTIGETDPAAGRIEATAESFWFGFIDDVAVRVVPSERGARIDVRSVSRVGGSDLGANSARVRAYLADLQARLNAPAS
jgi:hypothetical protein